MKTAFIFRVLLAALLLGLLAVGCQEDDFTVAPEAEQEHIQAFNVPEIPAEIAQHFTEEELATFQAGPPKEMLEGVESRYGSWHPVVAILEVEFNHRPVTGTYDEPYICSSVAECPPSAGNWLGYAELYTFEGTWFGMGPVTGGSTGSIHFFNGQVLPPVKTWMQFGNSELLFQTAHLSAVNGDDGSIVMILREDFYGGTGMFTGAYGYVYVRLYTHVNDLPGLLTGAPGHAYVFDIGWVHY
ncbi:MAG: hypothetical protein KDC66_01220 [Phaeodactylibacter sp.]|nr:hypothetical protein [Phaeodactylibacter sp.]MCB9273160.1 hypothetical protein [Lewinellaceae bacterium]